MQLPLPGKIIKKSNAIARARWQPESIWEPRIVALVASKVRESDEDFQTYKIPVAELTGGSDSSLSGFQYKEIKKSILHIAKASILIPGEKNPHNFMTYPIFSACGYEDGYLVARFDPDLKPHFLHLKAQFTAYNLMEYLMLPSSYSQQIFEFLKSWANAPEVLVPIAELHELLNLPESFRKNFAEFRRWVLEKAHKDITGKTALRYEWVPVKKGRAVVAVRFIFAAGRIAQEATAEQRRIEADPKKKKELSTKILTCYFDKHDSGAKPCKPKKTAYCAKCLQTLRKPSA
jgi:plasmid replication initiation protein